MSAFFDLALPHGQTAVRAFRARWPHAHAGLYPQLLLRAGGIQVFLVPVDLPHLLAMVDWAARVEGASYIGPLNRFPDAVCVLAWHGTESRAWLLNVKTGAETWLEDFLQ